MRRGLQAGHHVASPGGWGQGSSHDATAQCPNLRPHLGTGVTQRHNPHPTPLTHSAYLSVNRNLRGPNGFVPFSTYFPAWDAGR